MDLINLVIALTAVGAAVWILNVAAVVFVGIWELHAVGLWANITSYGLPK